MDGLLIFGGGVLTGLVLGTAFGMARAFRLVRARRAVAGAAAGFARFGLESLPTRSAADILAGRIRVVLGGLPYELPVLPRKASREWLASLDERFAFLSKALDQAADDKPRILALLAGQSAGLLEMLRSYDRTNVLPEAMFLDEFATDSEILLAMVEVWRATNPLAATLAEAADGGTDGTPLGPPSLPRSPTGGDLASSMP